MSEKDSGVDDLIVGSAIVAGIAGTAYVIYKLLTSGGKKTTLFRCGYCGAIVKENQINCGRCGRQLMWGGKSW